MVLISKDFRPLDFAARMLNDEFGQLQVDHEDEGKRLVEGLRTLKVSDLLLLGFKPKVGRFMFKLED